MDEKIQRFILLMVGVLAMSVAIGYLVFAWVEPGANPPQGNVPAPINVGDVAQTKAGRLGIGFFDPHYYLSVGTTTLGINAGLKITNPGSQPSLYVEDEPGDATPFVIDADGIIHTPYTYAPKTGDVNRDGFVNYEDLTYIAMSFGCSSGNPCWNERIGADGITNPLYKRDADVNHDNRVDIKDIVLVINPSNYEYFNYFTSKGFLSLPAAQFIGLSSYPNSQALVVTDDVSSPLFYVLNNGNVGIGTSTPAQKLDVVGGYIRSDTGFCIGSSCITSWPGGNYWVLSGSNLYTSSTAWNVGIGTTSPGEKLTVTGGRIGQLESGTYGDCWGKWAAIGVPNLGCNPTNLNYYGLKLQWDSDAVVFGLKDYGSNRKDAIISWGDDSNDNLRFLSPVDTDAMIITGTGNVGIGTSPSYKLDVNGDTRITGHVGIGTSPNSNYPLYVVGTNEVGYFENSNTGARVHLAWDGLALVAIGNTDIENGGLRVTNGGVCVDNDGSCTPPSNGYIKAVGYQSGHSDIAEMIKVSSNKIEPGDVVIIDPENNNQFILTDKPYDTRVAGVISTSPGLTLGSDELKNHKVPLAITGIVPTKVTTINGPIRRGDLLTTSNIPGYAMKATEYKAGAILGKALESLESGEGKINVLITLQ